MSQVIAQSNSQEVQSIPNVFMIGQYSEFYAEISARHPGILLSVFNNDMEFAFEKWAGMLVEMENYAKEINYDINGLKLWLHIYFNGDGSIKYISYFPKPNSRNVPNAELSAFFKSFSKVYQLQVKSEVGFQHSASASFPTFFGNINKETAKK
jgi:hypothetical protein